MLVGTSTSGILQTELAYRQRDADGALPAWLHYPETHDTASLARFVQAALGLEGPAWVISTACSSGAKAYAAAARLIALGVIDAAVVGGCDTLCMTTLYGFRALELLSSEVCRPWDARRNGLSLGEGASFALLQRDDDAPAAWLLGCGESSDGHHMSSPHPEGAGAADAMRAALADAQLQPDQVDYINLHGTGTRNNDAAEDLAVCSVFGRGVPVSSTKGHTGHALGAAGAVEAAITLLALREGLLPHGLHCEQPDAALRANYLRQTAAACAVGGGEQLVRLRRQQRVPDLRSGAVSAAMTLNVAIAGVGVLGPGLSDWDAGCHGAAHAERLEGSAHGGAGARSPAERRTAPRRHRRQGGDRGGRPGLRDGRRRGRLAWPPCSPRPAAIRTTCHAMCEALARPERLLSPTRFTNSVHNAPAGYWHIAAQSRRASTSLAAYDASVCAGLLEAAAQCCSSRQPVLLVACDMPYPAPLHALRPLPDVFACALLLVPQGSAGGVAAGAVGGRARRADALRHRRARRAAPLDSGRARAAAAGSAGPRRVVRAGARWRRPRLWRLHVAPRP